MSRGFEFIAAWGVSTGVKGDQFRRFESTPPRPICQEAVKKTLQPDSKKSRLYRSYIESFAFVFAFSVVYSLGVLGFDD